jgi:hypothetical protein
MGVKVGWLLALVPLFSFLGSMFGVPNLGEAFKEAVPHIEAVVSFIALLLGIFGSKILWFTPPPKKN